MSLTSMIQNDCSWNSFFRENVPKKAEFKTISGRKAFSSEYEAVAENCLSSTNKAGTVGTAFDYLARWMVARVVTNKDSSYTKLIAQNGVSLCEHVAQREGINLMSEYERSIEKVKQYVEGGEVDVIPIAVFFAKLEQVCRFPSGAKDVSVGYLLDCELDIIEDLHRLTGVFFDKFIKTELVKASSDVVYNPKFGYVSYLCGGADADIYIDGALYDFKCTTKHGYAWKEVAQILGYFLLDSLAKKMEDENSSLYNHEIRRIALYHARYGEIEYIDVSRENYNGMIQSFETILGKDSCAKVIKMIDKHRKTTQGKKRLKRTSHKGLLSFLRRS